MPPRNKFTKGEIIKSAVELVEEKGMEHLTARELAKRLNVSVKPIFTAFENMDEVKKEVVKYAESIHEKYIFESIKGNYPKYKATGMAYIEFAKEKKELFKLLFMRDRTSEEKESIKGEKDLLLKLICESTGLSLENAEKLQAEMWVYVHGIATMIATNYLDWSMDFVSDTLTNVYNGLLKNFGK